jgi:predicted metal-dependent hydrolase
MATKRVIPDTDFGQIIIRTRITARNICMRTKADGLHVTVPPRCLTSKVLEVIEEYRTKLLEKWEKVAPQTLDQHFHIDAPCFRLHLEQGKLAHFLIRTHTEGTTIFYPPHADFSEKAVQEVLRNAIVRAMKKSAQAYLPPLLEELASHYGFHYKKVKITGSKSRWGSCSATGNINLSCYLMLLPPHLMDYVLLHELTHTKEMNHGPKFWEILNELTEGKARSLRSELKNFRTTF